MSDSNLYTMNKIIVYILVSLCLPLMHSCSHVAATNNSTGAFEYREIYLPEGTSPEGRDMGLNSVDADWAIWGHNLFKVVPKKHSHSIYATINETLDERQYCFSSPELLKYVVEYIQEHVGSLKPHRFAILPKDNTLSCQCERCKEKGCTPDNATPAVLDMITRLAKRYPNHMFFTSCYLTTRTLPKDPMPENSGVLISAIDYYLSPVPTKQEEDFTRLLQEWSTVTKNIYVWDYINNFDDYFTPFPVLGIMQHRFRLYEDNGVKGIFLNGSGHDYSSLSRVRTHLLAALMADPYTDWRILLRDICRKFYPVTGDVVADFMLEQEDYVTTRGKTLPLYDGVQAALRTYLPESAFIAFHDKLQELLPQTTGRERMEISKLVRTTMLTRLELMRLSGDVSGARPMVQQLSSVVADGVRIYSESFWTVDSYVKDYTELLNLADGSNRKNLLLGKKLIPLTALDEDYSDIGILTDGLVGLPSNYHCGQMLSSADPALRLVIPTSVKVRHLRVGFTSNVQFRIGLPLRVTLQNGRKDLLTVVPRPVTATSGRSVVEFDIPSSAVGGTLILNIERNTALRTMAIDEIEGY